MIHASWAPCALLLATPLQSAASDQDGVRVAINHSLEGHATGDASHMRKAFLQRIANKVYHANRAN